MFPKHPRRLRPIRVATTGALVDSNRSARLSVPGIQSTHVFEVIPSIVSICSSPRAFARCEETPRLPSPDDSRDSLASKLGFDPPIAAEDYFQERTRRMRFHFNCKYIDRHYIDQEKSYA
jgi:hypothetical protein